MIESNVVGQELSTLTPVNYDKNYGIQNASLPSITLVGNYRFL